MSKEKWQGLQVAEAKTSVRVSKIQSESAVRFAISKIAPAVMEQIMPELNIKLVCAISALDLTAPKAMRNAREVLCEQGFDKKDVGIVLATATARTLRAYLDGIDWPDHRNMTLVALTADYPHIRHSRRQLFTGLVAAYVRSKYVDASGVPASIYAQRFNDSMRNMLGLPTKL